MGFAVSGLGFGVEDGLGVWGLRLRVKGLGCVFFFCLTWTRGILLFVGFVLYLAAVRPPKGRAFRVRERLT